MTTKSNYREQLYLGKVRQDFKEDFIAGKRIYLSKHSWDCQWYWGFGYIGNTNLHTHFKSSFLTGEAYDIGKVFEETKLTQHNWWTILELFQTAYHLREAYEVYYRGGSHISNNPLRSKLQDRELATRIAKDLGEVLEKLWLYIATSIEDNTKELMK